MYIPFSFQGAPDRLAIHGGLRVPAIMGLSGDAFMTSAGQLDALRRIQLIERNAAGRQTGKTACAQILPPAARGHRLK